MTASVDEAIAEHLTDVKRLRYWLSGDAVRFYAAVEASARKVAQVARASMPCYTETGDMYCCHTDDREDGCGPICPSCEARAEASGEQGETL
jgi:7-cyano-7-deazaguanine synthase in queuosine biosynthesis